MRGFTERRIGFMAVAAVAAISLSQGAMAQTIKFYPPIPQTDRSATSPLPNPPPVVPTYSELAAGCSGPQAATTSRTFFQADGTSDSVTVPSNNISSTDHVSSTCAFDLIPYAGVVHTKIGDGVPPAVTPTDPLCVGTPGPALPAGWDLKCWTLPAAGIWPEKMNVLKKCMGQCFIADFPEYLTQYPESCKANQNFVRVTDGEQDLADTFLTDLAPVGAELIWPEEIPDPTDAWFPTKQETVGMALPIDVTSLKAVAGGLYQAEILNRLPLNQNVKAQIEALAPADLWWTWPGIIGRFPWYYAKPDFQNSGAHESGLASVFGLGPISPAATSPIMTYNDENECMTADTVTLAGWAAIALPNPHGHVVQDPKNCLSQPTSVRALDENGDGKEDSVHLYQRFYHSRLFKKTGEFFDPNWKDYCTNLNATLDGIPDLQTLDSPLKFYLALDLEVLNPMASIISLGLHIGAQGDVDNFSNLGYITSFYNTNAGATPDAALFKKQGSAASPWRYCVGQFPTDMEVANADGDTHKPDLFIVNYGAIDLISLLDMFGFGLPPGVPITAGHTSLNFMVAGGFTALENFDGQHSKMYYYPLNPTPLKSNDPVHPINVRRGDFNGDGKDDALVTFSDGMGCNVAGQSSVKYIMPNVVASPADKGPFGWDPGVVCNGDAVGDTSDCFEGVPASTPSGPLNPHTAIYTGLSPELAEFKCNRIAETHEKDMSPAVEPTPTDDTVVTPDPNAPDLWSCEGKATNPTCPELKPENASQFHYDVYYQGIFVAALPTAKWDADGDGTPNLPSGWAPYCTDSGGGVITCTDLPGFAKWECTFHAVVGPTVEVLCHGDTVVRGAPTFPVPDKLPAILREPQVLAETGKWHLHAPPGKVAVSRDMIFDCGVQFNLKRRSEFAVYMNKGNGSFYPPDHATVGNNFVEVAFTGTGMHKILSEVPLKRNWSTTFSHLGPGHAHMKKDSSGKIEGTVGLGPWPFAADCADLVDSNGYPVPDGKDDCVIGMGNAHEVCVFPSQGGLNPFTNTKMICFNSTSQDYKKKLAYFLQPATDKIAADPTGATLGIFDYLRLSIGMASTSYVEIPKDPINAADDIDGSPEKRLGIMVVHGNPWKVSDTMSNSILGLQFFNNIYGLFDYDKEP